MTNTNPIWKTLLLAVVLLLGILYALPNVFGSDPAVQVSGRTAVLTEQEMDRLERLLASNGFTDTEIRREDDRFLALFKSEDDQIRARDVIAESLDENNYTTTLNLEPASPPWLRSVAEPMNLGLDLRGGVHFLMEVDMVSAINSAEERYVPVWKRDARAERIRAAISHDNGVLTARFNSVEERDRMLEIFRQEGNELAFETREEGPNAFITANLTEQAAQEERRSALQQNVVTLRNRINELGGSEPGIPQQWADRIVVPPPGG